jgi:diguanylate cyclase (GGDEF)-like protein/PAS domain S-box-containing protein
MTGLFGHWGERPSSAASEKAERRLQRSLALEKVVAHVSELLIDLSPENSRLRLADVLEQLGQMPEVERGLVYHLSPDASVMELEAEWCAPGADRLCGRLSALRLSDYPWFRKQLDQGPIAVTWPAALPPEADLERRCLEELEIKSGIALPLRWGGVARGFLGVAFSRPGAAFAQDEIEVVTWCARLLSSAFEQRAHIEALQQNKALMEEAEQLASFGSWRWESDSGRVTWSQEMFHIFGLPVAEIPPPAALVLAMIRPEDRNWYQDEVVGAMEHQKAIDVRLRIVRPTGELRHVRILGEPWRDRGGEPRGYAGVVHDITEAQTTREVLRRASRSLHIISACNSAMARATDEAQLLADVCRIVVEKGGHALAWVGLTSGGSSPLPPAAFFGSVDPEFFPGLAARIADHDTTPFNEALRTRKTVRFDDLRIAGMPHPEFWAKRGFAACIGLPLLSGDELLGVLMVYAANPGEIDDDETTVLEQLAADLAFGIATLRSRRERDEAQHYLQATEESLRAVLEKEADGVLVLDRTARILFANPAALMMFGRSLEELQGEEFAFPLVIGEMVEIEVLRPDATRVTAEMRAAETEWYKVPALVVALHDVTQQRRSQEELRVWATVLEHSGELIFVTDARRRIVAVNKAFERITGYSAAEAIGRNPGFLSSGLEDRSFYAELWNSVTTIGHWQGEIRDRRKNGEVFPLWLAITAANGEPGQVRNYIAIGSDISARKAAEERIQFLAFHDVLTGLPNRALFRDRLQLARLRAGRTGGRLGVLFLDLDRFKNVNDSLGHEAGDELLRAVVVRLQECIRRDDTISRQGGDEFLILLGQIARPEKAGEIAAKIINEFARPFLVHGTEVHITPSIGIAIYPEDGDDADVLVKNADAAMYFAKERGRNNFQYFVAELNRRVSDRFALENSLRRALARSQFELYYQPQVNVQSGRVIGFEALLRWNREGRVIGASEFVGLAEETGLIMPIGEWVLQEACRQGRAWSDAGMPAARIAVNLSGAQFTRKGALDRLRGIVGECGWDPGQLEIELTEGVIMQEAETSLRSLRSLKEIGVSLAIDDFGTGYSSLSYLRRFPIDRLKVDQSFVRDLPRDPADLAVTAAILALARSLHLAVVAEGVETQEEMDLLTGLQCEEIQGFYFLPPRPVAEITAWWRERVAAQSQEPRLL